MCSSRSRLRGSPPALLALLAVPALALLAGCAACSSGTAGSGSGTAGGISASQAQSQYEQVVDHVLPSVVQISTSNSTGSGVVYDSKGDIVTNAHVVDGASTVMVREPV